MDTAEFLKATFGRCDSKSLITIFEAFHSKSTRWENANYGKVQDFVHVQRGLGAMYYNVATQSAANTAPTGKRGSKEHCYELPCLWADVDLAGKIDAKKNYPPDDVAKAAINALPFRPQVIVYSGGGIYPLWIFDEPFVSNSPEDVSLFEQCSGGWQQALREELQKHGEFDLDATHDVTRMLRIPGSAHQRTGRVVSAELTFESSVKFEQALAFAKNFRPQASGGQRADNSHVQFSIDPINPLRDKELHARVLALLDNSDEFRKIWERKRKLSSGSEYCLALCNILVQGGWTDQEIAKAWVTWRCNHNCISDMSDRDIERKIRLDIGKARSAFGDAREHEKKDSAAVEIDSVLQEINQAEQEEAPFEAESPVGHESNGKADPPRQDEARKKLLASISEIVCLNVTAIRKTGNGSVWVYTLVIDDGDRHIELGEPHKWIGNGSSKLVHALVPILNKRLLITKKQYNSLVDAILAAAEEHVERGISPGDYVLEILAAILRRDQRVELITRFANESPESENPLENAELTGQPFVEDGRLYVTLRSLEQAARAIGSPLKNRSEIASGCRELGSSSKARNTKIDTGRWTTYSCYSFEIAKITKCDAARHLPGATVN